MKEVISKVSETVIPSKAAEKSKNRIADLAFGLVEKKVNRFPEVVGVEFGGSFAKGTWLAKDVDIDIFLRFKKSTSEEKFEEIAKKIGFDSLKEYGPYVRYSDHPYVEAKIRNTKINLVPFYDTEHGDWKSAADRSSYHTKLMNKSLTSKMKNEVRILKAFLKSNRIYGAEIARKGFSGYVSEVLILNYKSFENVIKSVSEMEENTVIGKTAKKFDTSMVIIDPIDENRNLAAAISDENIGRFVLASRAFRERPSAEFFKARRSRVSKKYLGNLLIVKFEYKIRSPDIIWGQIKRTTASLSTQLELEGFRVLRSSSHTEQQNEACLLFLLESVKISDIYQKDGPEFFRKNASKKFISKNLRNRELVWIGKNKRITSVEKRKHTDAAKFITEFLKNNPQPGIPKGLKSDFKRGFKVSYGNESTDKSIKEAVNELVSTDASLLYFN